MKKFKKKSLSKILYSIIFVSQNQLQDEQIKFNNEINSLKQQLDDLNKDKVKRRF